MGKEPGDWYGVNSIAQVMQNIFNEGRDNHYPDSVFTKLDFLTFQEGTIFMDDLRNLIGKCIEDSFKRRSYIERH
jgi:hypothetical protein